MRLKPSNRPSFLSHFYPRVLNSDHIYSTVSWSSWQIATSSSSSYPSVILPSLPLLAHSKTCPPTSEMTRAAIRGEDSCGHKSRAGPKVVGNLEDSNHERNIAQVTDDAACHASLWTTHAVSVAVNHATQHPYKTTER
jgi:hypothetical protein